MSLAFCGINTLTDKKDKPVEEGGSFRFTFFFIVEIELEERSGYSFLWIGVLRGWGINSNFCKPVSMNTMKILLDRMLVV